ncbi:MAG: ribosome recycling factor [Candidatus Dojkabacteria bacterium]
MLFNQEELKNSLSKVLEHFDESLRRVKTGKANASDIEAIKVEAYGGITNLNAVGQVLVEDAMNVKVVVWDKGILPNVEKALREAQTGGSVAIDRDFIRLKFSPITEEDRRKRVKEVYQLAEEYKVRVRQVRQDFMKKIDALDGVSEDEQERDKKTVQKEIDSVTEKIDEKAKIKEQEILKI